MSPGLGCEAVSETPVGTGGLLARVRTDSAAKQREGAVARRPERQGGRTAARPAPRLSERVTKAPRVAQDARPALLRSFYTCSTATPPDLAEGTGWRLVGPLRQG